MPFKSLRQRRYLYAKHPEIAKEFAAATPKGARLPERVSSSAELKKETKSGFDMGLFNAVQAVLFLKRAWVGPSLGHHAAAAASVPGTKDHRSAVGVPRPTDPVNAMTPGLPQAQGRLPQVRPPMPYEQQATQALGVASATAAGLPKQNALKMPGLNSSLNAAARPKGIV